MITYMTTHEIERLESEIVLARAELYRSLASGRGEHLKTLEAIERFIDLKVSLAGANQTLHAQQ
jgi:hypothetical protein